VLLPANGNYRGEADPPPNTPQTDDDASGKLCDCGPGGRYVWANSAGQVLAPAPDDDTLDYLTPEGYLNFQALVPELIQLPGIAPATYGSSYLNSMLNLSSVLFPSINASGMYSRVLNDFTSNYRNRHNQELPGLYFNDSGTFIKKVPGREEELKIYVQVDGSKYVPLPEFSFKDNVSKKQAVENIVRYVFMELLTDNNNQLKADTARRLRRRDSESIKSIVSVKNTTNPDAPMASTNIGGIAIEGVNGQISENLYTVDNLKSMLYHELQHFFDINPPIKKINPATGVIYEYGAEPIPISFKRHAEIYEEQMDHSSFKDTTRDFKHIEVGVYLSYLIRYWQEEFLNGEELEEAIEEKNDFLRTQYNFQIEYDQFRRPYYFVRDLNSGNLRGVKPAENPN
jgi:hypothetical protein